MVIRYIIIFSIIYTGIYAKNIYERNCVSCHKSLPTNLQGMFMNYLLVYGGEKNTKAGLKHYLKHPSKHISVMSVLFINNYGIKEKTKLNDAQLDEVLDIYWDKFKVFDKLK